MKRSLFALLFSFALSLIFAKILIPFLRKWKAGQNILSYVQEHKQKSGTPTMGGVAFIIATVFSTALLSRNADRKIVLSIMVGLAFMIVGLLDDFLKCKHKENLGLLAWQKFTFQACISLLASVFCFRIGATQWQLPFSQTSLEFGVWSVPLHVFVFLATVNAVNLTDGLDGLASGVSVPFFFFIGLLVFLQGGDLNFTILSFALVGALLGYLPFNVAPASVFMGDTGSLALGGFAACICSFSGNALYIVVIGLPFVFSVVSVIIQVIYFKRTGGKRVFLMSPLHHHFQKKGYSESKISYVYFLISALLGVCCICALL